MKKQQFNPRIPENLKIAAVTVSAALGFKREEIAEVAYASLLGSTDEVIVAKRNKIQRKAKELQLSFDHPHCQSDEDLIAA